MKFKGWQMVYTGMVMEFAVVGFIFYCFPLMFNALERDLGASQSQLSGALSPVSYTHLTLPTNA